MNIVPNCPSEHQRNLFNEAFDWLLVAGKVNWTDEDDIRGLTKPERSGNSYQGAWRTLRETWLYFFNFFITTPSCRWLTEYHVANNSFKHSFDNHSFDVSDGFTMLSRKEFKVYRDWQVDDEGKYFVDIDVWNTVSTDSFQATKPRPTKTYVQLFQHIFVRGLHQFSFFSPKNKKKQTKKQKKL